MQVTEQLETIYQAYFAALEKARKEAKPTDGLLGFGQSLGSHPCQSAFAERIEAALQQIAAAAPDADTAYAALQCLCSEPKNHRDDSVAAWMLAAVHGYGKVLVPFITQEQAASLVAFYEENYPARDRLPVQEEFYKALCRQSGKAAARTGWFHRK